MIRGKKNLKTGNIIDSWSQIWCFYSAYFQQIRKSCTFSSTGYCFFYLAIHQSNTPPPLLQKLTNKQKKVKTIEAKKEQETE